MFKFYLMAALCFCCYCTISAQTHTPVAQAGADAFIVLPANLSLNGLQSSDPDGMIVSYHRRKISGPASHLFSDSTVPNPTVQNLTTGLYSFEPTVTDNRNASAADSISIQVLSDAPFTWDGAISTDWQNAANWKDNLPPSSAGIVIIPAGRLHYPIIQTPISVKSLFCATGAAVTVASNGSLRISGTTNLPPVANSGSDISIVLPLDSVTLSGCTSNDPEGGTLRYKWRKISGPAQSAFTNDTLCNSKVRGLVAGNYSFELLVTDSENLTNKDTVQLSVTQGFSFAWPVLPAPPCPQAYNVVILGSSTAFGTGASPLDSSWAKKFKKYVQQQNAQVTVTNLALGGYNSYHVNPTGFIPAANKPAPDTARNITAALALNPDAIIINLPSNDAAAAFTLQESQANFNRVVAVADSQNVPVWVTTSQPRSGLSAGATNNLILLKDWVLQRFGNKAIDFWTDIANADGSVNTYYSAGDGVHINNFGHHTVFARVLQEKLWDSICIRRTAAVNIPPFANAGTDVLLQWPADSISLNGTASNDQDGTIIQYKWQKIQGGNATIVNDGIANPWVRDLAVGNYSFELVVTDDSLAVDKDTVMVRVNEQPIARAGVDGSITLPVNSISLNGSSSNDPDGSVTIFGWRKVSGPAGETITNSAASQTNVSFTNTGIYVFELTVTDNNGGVHKDSVSITVNPDPNVRPVARAGQDNSIQLPVNRVLLDGRLSSDANGTIASYLWSYMSGPSGSQLLTASKDSSTVTFANAGTYVFRLTVTDNAGLTGTDDVQITVVAAPVTTKAIKVNVINGGITYNNAQWNNWGPVANVNSATFKYEDGSQSTVFANLAQGGNFSDNAANYQPAATGCPPEVLRINSMHTIQRTLTVSSLDPSKSYSFEFYGSRGFTSNSRSVYRTGSKSDTITTDFNANDVARLNDILPDNNGRIVFTLSIIGTYHYMAGFTIKEPATAPGIAANFATELRPGVDVAGQTLEATIIYPNPFSDRIQVKLGNAAGLYKLFLTDVAGKIILQKNVASSGAGAVENLATKNLQRGTYFLQILTTEKRTTYKLIKK